MLAATRGLGGVEGGENGLRSVQPGYEVRDRGADLVGRAVGRSRDVLDAGFALHDDVVAGTVFHQAGIAESGYRAIHHAGAARGYGSVTEAEAVHRAGPEILDQHVRRIDQ